MLTSASLHPSFELADRNRRLGEIIQKTRRKLKNVQKVVYDAFSIISVCSSGKYVFPIPEQNRPQKSTFADTCLSGSAWKSDVDSSITENRRLERAQVFDGSRIRTPLEKLRRSPRTAVYAREEDEVCPRLLAP